MFNISQKNSKTPNKCPICNEEFNTTNLRKIKELCEHIKCRQCLLNEKNGCDQCQKTCNIEKNTEVKECLESEKNMLHNKCDFSDDDDSNKLEIDTTIDSENSLLEEEQRKHNLICDNDNIKDEILSKKKKKYILTTKKSFDHILLKKKDKESYYECTKCNRTFKSRANRHYHFFCGTDEKPLKCVKCLKSFVTKFHYNYHLETHIIKDSFKCIDCDRSFLRKTSLQKHIRIKHSLEFKYVCSECGVKFKLKNDMKIHENKHKNIFPYQCNKCNRGFTLKTNLKSHEIIHTGEKKFTCEICSKKFPRKSALRIHMLTHSQERNFECSECCKSFADIRSLKRHQSIHCKLKKFNCPKCETKCTRKDNFRRHLRNIHPDLNIVEILKVIEADSEDEEESKINETRNNTNNVLDNNKQNEKTDDVIFVPTIKDGPNTVNVIQFIGNVKPKKNNQCNKQFDKIDIMENAVYDKETSLAQNIISNSNSIESSHNNFNKKKVFISYLNPIIKKQCGNKEIKPFYNDKLSEESLSDKVIDKRSLSVCAETVNRKSSNINQITFPKKNKKIFNPIDIYRKILMPSTNIDNELQPIQNIDEILVRKEPNLIQKDFTEVHWRKRTSQSFNQN